MVVCRRRREIELEEKEKSTEEQKSVCEKEQERASYFQKTGGVLTQEETEAKRNMLEIKVIENPNSTEESDRYLTVATLQEESEDQEKEEEVSVKAFRQSRDSKDAEDERKSPWLTSKEAAKRAKESLEHAKKEKRIIE